MNFSLLKERLSQCRTSKSALELHCIIARLHNNPNLVPRAMPVSGLGWHWLWENGMICVQQLGILYGACAKFGAQSLGRGSEIQYGGV